MLVDIIVLIMLCYGFLIGLKRGLILQVIRLVSIVLSIFVAYMYHEALAEKLQLWIPYPSVEGGNAVSLLVQSSYTEELFYRIISFAILFFLTNLVIHIIGSLFDFVAQLPILRHFNKWAGAILGFVEIYVIVFIVLYIIALLPVGGIQAQVQNSSLAGIIVNHTPYLSDMIPELWGKDI
ncbi:CvpA family protein [Priestia endophytica]|uniref:CvpA family protein n=1 Tax=Priestia endophytica TaxID=135735 RepID=UPI00227FFD61|nr:CvpA family protein [Priestia endophytica]MCY8233740.1 CvpA family protein [Priestia endophytica]